MNEEIKQRLMDLKLELNLKLNILYLVYKEEQTNGGVVGIDSHGRSLYPLYAVIDDGYPAGSLAATRGFVLPPFVPLQNNY